LETDAGLASCSTGLLKSYPDNLPLAEKRFKYRNPIPSPTAAACVNVSD